MKRTRNAYAAPNWAAEQRVGDVGTKAVLLTLANYADEAFSCYPEQQTLADETEQSVRQVRRQVQYLEVLGLIRREKRYRDGKRTSDRYFLLLDNDVQVTGDDPRKALLRGEKVPSDQPVLDDATQADEPAMGADGLPASLSGSTTGQSVPQVTTGQSGATTGQSEPATTGQEWPRKSQELPLENSQESGTAAPTADGSNVRPAPSTGTRKRKAEKAEPAEHEVLGEAAAREWWESLDRKPAGKGAWFSLLRVCTDVAEQGWTQAQIVWALNDLNRVPSTPMLDGRLREKAKACGYAVPTGRRGRADVRHVDSSTSAEQRAAREALTA